MKLIPFEQFVNEQSYRYVNTKLSNIKDNLKPIEFFLTSPYDFRGMEYVSNTSNVHEITTNNDFITYYLYILPALIFNHLTEQGYFDFEDKDDLYWEDGWQKEIDNILSNPNKFIKLLKRWDSNLNSWSYSNDLFDSMYNVEWVRQELKDLKFQYSEIEKEQNNHAGQMNYSQWEDEEWHNYYGKLLTDKQIEIDIKQNELKNIPTINNFNDYISNNDMNIRFFLKQMQTAFNLIKKANIHGYERLLQ